MMLRTIEWSLSPSRSFSLRYTLLLCMTWLGRRWEETESCEHSMLASSPCSEHSRDCAGPAQLQAPGQHQQRCQQP